jgi:hypothetical protein
LSRLAFLRSFLFTPVVLLLEDPRPTQGLLQNRL